MGELFYSFEEKIRWELSDDELIDNAAGCSQFRPLCSDMDETDESLRECIKLNVCKPLRQRIAALEAERDEAVALLRSFQWRASAHDHIQFERQAQAFLAKRKEASDG